MMTRCDGCGEIFPEHELTLVQEPYVLCQKCLTERKQKMNEQQILEHLRASIPESLVLRDRIPGPGGLLGRLGSGALGQKIIEIIVGMIGQSGFTLEAALAAAKKFYDERTAGDNPNIPNWFESIAEAVGWWGLEWAIRRAFAAAAAQPV